MSTTSRIRRGLFASLLLAAAGAAAPSAALAARYGVQALPLGDFAQATAINVDGQVTGCAFSDRSQIVGPFRFSAGTVEDLSGGFVNGASFACGEAINRFGTIAGTVTDDFGSAGSRDAGFLIRGTTVLGDGGQLFGLDSRANGINDRGQVVGAGRVFERFHAFLWSAGFARDLGTLGGDRSEAFATARAGQAVGSSSLAGGATHAFLYAGGQMRDLGTLGGANSRALAMTPGDHVAGGSTLRSGGERAFLWTPAVGMRSLGTLAPKHTSTALALNSLDQVVGRAGTAAGDHAFLWTPQAGMRDLNALIPAASGWTLVEATGINRRGQIVGNGILNGQRTAFLLTPA